MKRLLEANASHFAAMDAPTLAEAIRASEGRSLAAEVICTAEPPVDGVSHGELAAAMGADIIVLDAYDPLKPSITGAPPRVFADSQPLANYKRLLGRPLGINMIVAGEATGTMLGGRRVTEQHIATVVQQGADMVFLYVRPRQGGTAAMQQAAAQQIKSRFRRELLLVGVPSFSKPAPRRAAQMDDYLDEVAALLEAGCEGIGLPMPGTKQGWQPDHAAHLVERIQAKGGLACLFVTGSVEGAPPALMHSLALSAKQIGADMLRLDEAGLSGMPPPENILAFSLALRGARHTYRRMAASILR